ncbi:DMT family transporter [Paenibacillus jiagnxiensis]|uniref:DMT family transporter n=1 Tax=Paenibacillus jiagnxiensis TaxID=3228926 RepID=UPI0033ACB0B7
MSNSRILILTLFTMLVAGLNFPLGKISLSYGSTFVLLGIRFVGAGLLMLPFIWGRPHPRSAASWLKLAVIGLFQSTLVMGLNYLSMRTISSGSASILSSSNPIWFIVFSFLLFKARYRSVQWAGVIIGFAGVAMTQGFAVQMQSGFWLSLGAGMAWGMATLLTSRWGKEFDTWVMAAYQMLIGGAILFIPGPFVEHPSLIWDAANPFKELFVLGWMILISSIAQFVAWYYVLSNSDPNKANVYLFLIPLFGVLSGWLILKEPLHWYTMAGAVIIGIGIYLVNRPAGERSHAVSVAKGA